MTMIENIQGMQFYYYFKPPVEILQNQKFTELEQWIEIERKRLGYDLNFSLNKITLSEVKVDELSMFQSNHIKICKHVNFSQLINDIRQKCDIQSVLGNGGILLY